MNVTDSLIKLEALTEQIVPRLGAIVKHDQGNLVEFDVAGGEAFALNLFSIPEVSVNRSFFSQGLVFPTHTHDEKEWLIVYKGRCVVECGGKSIDLKAGDMLYVPPEGQHTVRFVENTWMIVISIPAAAGFASGDTR